METNSSLEKGYINVVDKNNAIKTYDLIDAQGDYLENRDSAGHETHDGEGMGHEAGDPGHFSTFENDIHNLKTNKKTENLSLRELINFRK